MLCAKPKVLAMVGYRASLNYIDLCRQKHVTDRADADRADTGRADADRAVPLVDF